ncbi:hypothetical protein JCM8097_002778, partial [Rhodosporidiobolus ruineniae]
MELPSKDCYLEFPSIPGVYGWVEVDGKPLELHGIKTTRQSACAHIEAEGNKPFSVCYADLRREAPEDSFEVDQSVDGTSMNILQFNKNDELWTTKPNYRDRYTRWSGWHMPGGKTQKSYFFPATDGTAHTGSISLTYERVKLNEEKPQEQEVPHPDELESAPREFFALGRPHAGFSPTSPVYSPMFDVGYSSTAAAPRRADNRSPSLGIGPSHLHDNRESDAAIPTPQNLSSRLPREQGCAPTRK